MRPSPRSRRRTSWRSCRATAARSRSSTGSRRCSCPKARCGRSMWRGWCCDNRVENAECPMFNDQWLVDIDHSTLDIRCESWRRPTLPPPRRGSTIGADRLNDRVRDGNGCGPVALVASQRRQTRGGCGVADHPGHRRDQASRAISTARLKRSRAVHLPPINLVVSQGPLGALRLGSVHLGEGFPLRCIQRLSPRDIANRRCPWQDSRDTRGRFVRVLSYYGRHPSTLQRPYRIQTELSHDVLNPAHVPL